MKIRIRFFARFRELFGPEVVADTAEGTSIRDLVRTVARGHPEGEDTIFDERGEFRRYVILMRNGERIETARADEIPVVDGDVIALFPPVAGG
jgi:molybdopterin synthase sulfur carrier subunit